MRWGWLSEPACPDSAVNHKEHSAAEPQPKTPIQNFTGARRARRGVSADVLLCDLCVLLERGLAGQASSHAARPPSALRHFLGPLWRSCRINSIPPMRPALSLAAVLCIVVLLSAARAANAPQPVSM